LCRANEFYPGSVRGFARVDLEKIAHRFACVDLEQIRHVGRVRSRERVNLNQMSAVSLIWLCVFGLLVGIVKLGYRPDVVKLDEMRFVIR
jgi:hypothetical protein